MNGVHDINIDIIYSNEEEWEDKKRNIFPNYNTNPIHVDDIIVNHAHVSVIANIFRVKANDHFHKKDIIGAKLKIKKNW